MKKFRLYSSHQMAWLLKRIRTRHKDIKKLQVIGDELISKIINSEKEFLIESRELII